jgi:formimidoylglutamate deiminase
MSHTIQADFTWTGARFEPDIQVEIMDDGTIGAVEQSDVPATHRLKNRALLPGMVNAHSHAFQRGLRGQGESFPQGNGSFWTWREAMYGLVGRADKKEFRELCTQAFREMVAGGITTVGEFHYFHHERDARDFSYDRLVLEAASEVGIRIVLLNAYYRTGGIGQPLGSAQQRFETESLGQYWDNMDSLAADLDPGTQSLGVVAHSIRAVDIEEMELLQAEAHRRGWVFHLHIEEQRQEVDDCVMAFGHPPMYLLNEALSTMDNVTGVHCTHTEPEDMGRFLESGGTVCICPTTEANLGDGIADLVHVASLGGRICLGTDSNARISMMEEMRWLEYVQRLARESRGVLHDTQGNMAPALFESATVHGAQALGIDGGRIGTGAVADFLTVDLTSSQLSGWTPETLLTTFVVGADVSVVDEVWVGGRAVGR